MGNAKSKHLLSVDYMADSFDSTYLEPYQVR